MLTLKEKMTNKIFFGGSSCGGGCSPTYYYHPEKAYPEAYKIWHKEVLDVFNKYEIAINELSNELEKTFEKESLKLELIILEELSNLKIKAIELEEIQEDSQEIHKKKKWLDEVIKEINDILEI